MSSFFVFLLLSASIVSLSSAAYDESFARNKALPLAGAAYSKTPEDCLKNRFVNAQLKGKYEFKCDGFKGDTCFGFTAVSHGDKAVIVAFRGSSGFLEILAEGIESMFDKRVAAPIGGQVSYYFYEGYSKLWEGGMKNDFLTLKNQNPGYQVWVTGHSLGGAMATVAASNIVHYGYATASNVKLYTFGQPRTGDKTYAAKHDSVLPNSYRLTHKADMVPHVPPENLLDYFHHKSEIWYDNDMTINSKFVDCDADESKSCSDGLLIKLSIKDHLKYFNTGVSEYGEAGCK